MHKRFVSCKYQEDVSKILHSIGMDRIAAKELTHCYSDYFESINRFKYQLPRQIFQLITTRSFLEHILTKCFKPHYSIYHYIESINVKLRCETQVHFKKDRASL